MMQKRRQLLAIFFLIISITMIPGCLKTIGTTPESPKEPPSNNKTIPRSKPKESPSPLVVLNDVMKSARDGMTPESPFNVINSNMAQVKNQWDEPDQIDKVGTLYYAIYNTKNTVFGFTENGDILDIRSYNKNLTSITLDLLTKELGQPQEIRTAGDEKIYVYLINSSLQLKFIIPKAKSGVDHISIFNQQKNSSNTASKTFNYYLDIRGKSNLLSPQAWKNMQVWRTQIVEFAKTQENVYINGPDKKMVALTFDDGPDQLVTPAIIDILSQHGVVGNFFFLGKEVNKYPDVVKKAQRNGNLVLSHSDNHVELTKLSNDQIARQVKNSVETIKAVTGQAPKFLRPPYGETNAQVAQVAKDTGVSIVLWSIDTLDWSDKSAANIVKNVLDNVRNGDIILMHSDSEKIETQKALPTIIKELKKRNFEIVDLETLLEK